MKDDFKKNGRRLLSTLSLSAVAGATALAGDVPPSVIFILVDDLGIGDVGAYGQRWIKIPALDALAENGMIFTQHYAGCTVSAPSRGSLLTGLHTGNSYIRGNKNVKNPDGHTYDNPLISSAFTLGELFQRAGYRTACVGKWGLGGPGTEGHPNQQGFDYFYGYLGQLNAHRHFPEFLHENETLIPLHGEQYAQELITEKALAFVTEQVERQQPYFLYLAPTIPHADLHATPEDLAQYEGKFCETEYPGDWYRGTKEPRATFAAMVSRMDRDVQQLVDLLRTKGVLENTLIIFSSDNGTHEEGGHDPAFFDSNGPFRGAKRDLYDGGIRTPLIVHWPEKVRRGSVSYHLSAFWDFLPTFAELTGQPTPEWTDGISLLPTLTGEGEQKEHEYLYWEFHEMGGRQAVRAGAWKLIRLQARDKSKSYYELYNLYADPGEQQNVFDLYPEVAERLMQYIEESHTPSEVYQFFPDE